MTNSQVADVFGQIADILEFQGANAFRVRAYRNVSRTIRDLPQTVSSILEDPDQQLTDISGIGKDLAEKCRTLVETGSLPMLDELRAQVPDSVLSILRVPGLGPKKAAQLFAQLEIKSLDDLRAACEAGTVRELKGFGEKTERTILDGIQLAAQSSLRVLWSQADELVSELRDYLGKCPAVKQLEFAGSYRRRRDTVGDLDILVVSRDSADVMDHFGAFDRVENVIVRGDTKMSVRVDSGLQIDLRVVPAKSFGAALQYFTGSKEHNVVLRGRAKAAGLKINEWGVFRVDGDDEHYVAGKTEKEVYATLDLPCFAPELRENRREFAWAEQGSLPKLVQLSDIRGDLHMHTTATDGKASIEEMAAAAVERGLTYVAITDHSKRVSMAFGLDDKQLLKQWEEIDALNESLGNEITILKGIECDILEKGGMDLEDKTLAQADWVVASIHYGQNQSRQQITNRMLGAIRNPHVDVIGHPTGRLLLRRDAYEMDMDDVLQSAAETGTMLELNAHPKRLDVNDVWCAAAKDRGILVVINSDAHNITGLDVMRYGIGQARRAGLSKQDVANTRSWRELRKLLKA